MVSFGVEAAGVEANLWLPGVVDDDGAARLRSRFKALNQTRPLGSLAGESYVDRL